MPSSGENRIRKWLRAFSILVGAAALMCGIARIRSQSSIFRTDPVRAFPPAFQDQVRAVEARAPAGSVLLYVEPPSSHWFFVVWRRALYPRNEMVLLESPVSRERLALLRSRYGIRFAVAAGDPSPDPGFLWKIDLGRATAAGDTTFGELAP